MKERKLILWASFIPLLFILCMILHQVLEKFFRFSPNYRFVYSSGKMILILIQFGLIPVSFFFTFHMLFVFKKYRLLTVTLALLMASSVFVYMTGAMLAIFLKVYIE